MPHYWYHCLLLIAIIIDYTLLISFHYYAIDYAIHCFSLRRLFYAIIVGCFITPPPFHYFFRHYWYDYAMPRFHCFLSIDGLFHYDITPILYAIAIIFWYWFIDADITLSFRCHYADYLFYAIFTLLIEVILAYFHYY